MERNQTNPSLKNLLTPVVGLVLLVGGLTYLGSRVTLVPKNIGRYETIQVVDMEPEGKYVTKWYIDNKPFGSLDEVKGRFLQENSKEEKDILIESIFPGDDRFAEYEDKYKCEVFPTKFPNYNQDQ